MSDNKPQKAATKLTKKLGKASDASTLGSTIGNVAVSAMLVDIVARIGTHAVRKGIENTLLPRKADVSGEALENDKSKDLAPEKPGKSKPTIAHKLVVGALAKLGTKSLPGAAAVGGAIVAREVYLRRKAKRMAGDPAAPKT